MSIFPFINPTEIRSSADELPLFKEYAYDFENNCLLYKNGNTYLVEGNEALKIWIWSALNTTRFRYGAFTFTFGNEVDTLIGKSMSAEIIHAEIRRFIIEALMVNPYIEELSNFNFIKLGSELCIDFDCNTLYGSFSINKDWKEV